MEWFQDSFDWCECMDILTHHYGVLSKMIQMSRCVGVCIFHVSGLFHTQAENLL